jgi:Plant mobile domain
MTKDVDFSSTSRQDESDTGERVLSMGIAYQRYFKFLICYYKFLLRPWIYYKFDLIIFCRYTRVFCLELFGSVMFPNNSADLVPAVYLTYLDDMLNVPEDGYDWGQTVLSCLYFNLSRSYLEPADCIAGPLLLLQIWLWTRFPIKRSS